LSLNKHNFSSMRSIPIKQRNYDPLRRLSKDIKIVEGRKGERGTSNKKITITL